MEGDGRHSQKGEQENVCMCGVGWGGVEKRGGRREEKWLEQICKHHTLLTTYTHSTHNLGGAWPPTRSSSSVICGSIDEACEDVYSHNGGCDCHPSVLTTVFTLCIFAALVNQETNVINI